MFKQLVDVARGLVCDHNQLLVGRDSFVMLPMGPGWPMRVYVDTDVVRVLTGMGSRIKVATQDDSPIDLVEQILGAVQAGDAEEFLGALPDGHIDVIGHRVWYRGGSLLALDEDREVLATCRAEAWQSGSPRSKVEYGDPGGDRPGGNQDYLGKPGA